MKATILPKKLTLNKKTIANLENKEMNAIRGGCKHTHVGSGCYTTSIPYCCW
jgi:natural product precursor